MRIERGDHAADGFFHELAVVDVVDVLALDALVDFSEQTRLFPGQGGCGGGILGCGLRGRAPVSASPAAAAESQNTAPAASAVSVRDRVDISANPLMVLSHPARMRYQAREPGQ